MPDLLLIVLGTVLVNHFVLVRHSFLHAAAGRATGFDAALAIAIPSCTALLMTAAVMLPLDRLLLVPFQVTYLRLLALVGISAIMTRALAALAYRTPASLPPRGWQTLVMTNSSLLVVGLGNVTRSLGVLQSALLAVGLAAIFGLLLLALTELFARIDQQSVPRPFRGSPIVLIAAGLAALALLGLAGLVPN